MTARVLWIPGQMPNLNDIIDACGKVSKQHGRGGKRWNAYSDMKKAAGTKVSLFALQQRFAPLSGPAHFEYEFVEPNRRRDPSNVVAGGIKILEDALKLSKLIPNDGWEHVLSIQSTWSLDKERPGVRVTVREE